MKARVNISVMNLYVLPDERSEVVSQALYGWPIKVMDQQGLFKHIQTHDGYEGWALAQELIDYRQFKQPLVKVHRNAVHVYATSSVKKQKPLLTLPFEVCLEVIEEPEEEQKRWICVKLLDEAIGWVHREDVSFDHSFLNRNQMLHLSRQFLGLPYTWGGVSSFGYDCSGFTQMLFRQMGIELPRDASQQIQCSFCEEVSINEMIPSDLIFFGSSINHISHVGIYIGSHSIIHASVKQAPIVQITHLEDSSLTNRFSYVTARRIKG